jgi:hypothetical protein
MGQRFMRNALRHESVKLEILGRMLEETEASKSFTRTD